MLFFHFYDVLTDFEAEFGVELVLKDRLQNYRSHVLNLVVGKHFQSGHKLHKLVIVGIVIPTQNGDAVFRLKLIAIRRVVYYYGLL